MASPEKEDNEPDIVSNKANQPVRLQKLFLRVGKLNFLGFPEDYDVSGLENLREPILVNLTTQRGLNSLLLDETKSYEDKVQGLLNTWEPIANFVMASARKKPAVEPVIMSTLVRWIYPSTLKVVFHNAWGGLPGALKTHFTMVISRCLTVMTLPDNVQLLKTLLRVMEQPWDEQIRLIMTRHAAVPLLEALEYLNMEKAIVLATRLELLCYDPNLEEFTMRLAEVCVACMQLPGCALGDDGDQGDKRYRNFIYDVCVAGLRFQNRLHEACLVLDYLSVNDCTSMADRFLRRTNFVLRGKFWKECHEVMVLCVQHNLSRSLFSSDQQENVLERVFTEYVLLHRSTLGNSDYLMNTVSKTAQYSSQLFILARVLNTEFGKDVNSLCIALYIRGLNQQLNELEQLRSAKVRDPQRVLDMEVLLSDGFLRLAGFSGDNVLLRRESVLTAFSLNPTDKCREELIKVAVECGHVPPMTEPGPVITFDPVEVNEVVVGGGTESEEAPTPVYYDCLQHSVNASGQLCDTCGRRTLLMYDVRVEDADTLGLTQQICDDLIVVLKSPRWKFLSWTLDWTELLNVCAHFVKYYSTRTDKKELIYLHLDYDKLDGWKIPEKVDAFAGIEKGYEGFIPVESDSEAEDFPPIRKISKKRALHTDSESSLEPKRRGRKPRKLTSDTDNGRLAFVSKKRRNLHLLSAADDTGSTVDSDSLQGDGFQAYIPEPPRSRSLVVRQERAKDIPAQDYDYDYVPNKRAKPRTPPVRRKPLVKKMVKVSVSEPAPALSDTQTSTITKALRAIRKTKPNFELSPAWSALPELTSLGMLVPAPAEATVHMVQLSQVTASKPPEVSPANSAQREKPPPPDEAPVNNRVTLEASTANASVNNVGNSGSQEHLPQFNQTFKVASTVATVVPAAPMPPVAIAVPATVVPTADAVVTDAIKTSAPQAAGSAASIVHLTEPTETTIAALNIATAGRSAVAPAGGTSSSMESRTNDALVVAPPTVGNSGSAVVTAASIVAAASGGLPNSRVSVEVVVPRPGEVVRYYAVRGKNNTTAIVKHATSGSLTPYPAVSNVLAGDASGGSLVHSTYTRPPMSQVIRVIRNVPQSSGVVLNQRPPSLSPNFPIDRTRLKPTILSSAFHPRPPPCAPSPAPSAPPTCTVTRDDVQATENSSDQDVKPVPNTRVIHPVLNLHTGLQTPGFPPEVKQEPGDAGGRPPVLNPTAVSSSTLEQLLEFEGVLKQFTETSKMKEKGEIPAKPEVAPEFCVGAIPCLKVPMSRILPGPTVPVQVVPSVIKGPKVATKVVVVTSTASQVLVASPGKTPPSKSPKSSKSKTVKSSPGSSGSVSGSSSSKCSPVPKPQQKPQEDEQTAQRIYAILDEYAEQLRNSPDLNNKPAPRRRSNPPTNPSQSSKRKKSSSKGKLSGQGSSTAEMSPGVDDPTMGSEDSSSTTMQLSLGQESPLPEEPPLSVPAEASNEAGNLKSVVTETTSETEVRGHHRLICGTVQGVFLKDPPTEGNKSVLPIYVHSNVRQMLMHTLKGQKVIRVQQLNVPGNAGASGQTTLVLRQMMHPKATPPNRVTLAFANAPDDQVKPAPVHNAVAAPTSVSPAPPTPPAPLRPTPDIDKTEVDETSVSVGSERGPARVQQIVIDEDVLLGNPLMREAIIRTGLAPDLEAVSSVRHSPRLESVTPDPADGVGTSSIPMFYSTELGRTEEEVVSQDFDPEHMSNENLEPLYLEQTTQSYDYASNIRKSELFGNDVLPHDSDSQSQEPVLVPALEETSTFQSPGSVFSMPLADVDLCHQYVVRPVVAAKFANLGTSETEQVTVDSTNSELTQGQSHLDSRPEETTGDDFKQSEDQTAGMELAGVDSKQTEDQMAGIELTGDEQTEANSKQTEDQTVVMELTGDEQTEANSKQTENQTTVMELPGDEQTEDQPALIELTGDEQTEANSKQTEDQTAVLELTGDEQTEANSKPTEDQTAVLELTGDEQTEANSKQTEDQTTVMELTGDEHTEANAKQTEDQTTVMELTGDEQTEVNSKQSEDQTAMIGTAIDVPEGPETLTAMNESPEDLDTPSSTLPSKASNADKHTTADEPEQQLSIPDSQTPSDAVIGLISDESDAQEGRLELAERTLPANLPTGLSNMADLSCEMSPKVDVSADAEESSSFPKPAAKKPKLKPSPHNTRGSRQPNERKFYNTMVTVPAPVADVAETPSIPSTSAAPAKRGRKPKVPPPTIQPKTAAPVIEKVDRKRKRSVSASGDQVGKRKPTKRMKEEEQEAATLHTKPERQSGLEKKKKNVQVSQAKKKLMRVSQKLLKMGRELLVHEATVEGLAAGLMESEELVEKEATRKSSTGKRSSKEIESKESTATPAVRVKRPYNRRAVNGANNANGSVQNGPKKRASVSSV